MGKYFSSTDKTIQITDEWFRPIVEKRDAARGKTFVPTSDGSPKVMYEGYGLKKFTKFVTPVPNKNGQLDNFVNFLKLSEKKLDYVPSGDESPATMYEGHGLKKFKKFVTPKPQETETKNFVENIKKL